MKQHDTAHAPAPAPGPGPDGQVGFPRMWKRTLALVAAVTILLFLVNHYGGDSYFSWRDEHIRESRSGFRVILAAAAAISVIRSSPPRC